jgi:predicted ATPase/class 3 adenylate cyclase
METPVAYLPTDRRLAIARGAGLPAFSSGAALFADISGFTPLTEALVRALGAQRGAEELPRQLNSVYDALIAETDRYGGSVLGFSGDAITCWFADEPAEDAALRAAACALAIQQTMQQFAAISIPGAGVVSLAIKVAVTTGRVRRFIVGDPRIQLIDVLAGETIARLATAEHLAERGDVMIDAACASALGASATIRAWRSDEASGERFAVLDQLAVAVVERPWPALDAIQLSEDAVRPWLLAPVFTRLQSGLGEFLTELRPAVALFLRFGGIDYDDDPQAEAQLNAYISWVMGVIDRFGGFLLQLTIGDKGSYLYAAFGAPITHENNATRALGAALALLQTPPEHTAIASVQIGVSQGRMRTGAYGGNTRRTYGVLGDDVNMAARLMQHAPPGQIYVSAAARQSTGNSFVWGALAPLSVKGKSEPITAYRLLGVAERRSVQLHEPQYTLPMIGREAELAVLREQVALALSGRGRIIGITAEAGMGKSRLIAELIRYTRAQQIVGYGGECQSYGTSTSYLVWQGVWRAFFNLRPEIPAAQQQQQLAVELAAIDPQLLPRLPLLGAVLNLPIPDTELTASFEPRLRKESLAALLVDCLRARAQTMPLLLVLEDCHWIDPLSHELLEVIGRAAADMPVLIALAYRPPQPPQHTALHIAQLPHFREVPLNTLPEEEVAQLIKAKLGQIFGAGAVLQPGLAEEIGARTQGNPFYVEELLNYLQDRGVDPQRPGALQQIDLPTSLYSLILSRIDQLTENQKTLIKVASVIGRLFRVAVLWGVYNQFGDQARARADLDVLSDLGLTPLDTPDPELAYLFKHILTQEVAYETLPFATRAMLHEQIGLYMEQLYAGALDQHLDLLAFHFDRSENHEKRRDYLLRAGIAAQAAYANTAAIGYYERALPLLDGAAYVGTLLKLGQVLETAGRWSDAEERAQQALTHAAQLGDTAAQAQALIAIGEVRRRQGAYAAAQERYQQAQELAAGSGDRSAIAKALICSGTLAVQQGDYAGAQERYRASLELRRALGDMANASNVLNNMSIVASYQDDLVTARALQEESLAIRRSIGNPWMIANSLNNLGMFATDQEEYTLAAASLEEAITLQRQIGDPSALATTLHTLANLRRTQGELAAALALYRESMELNRRLGDRWMLVQLLEDLGWLMALRGAPHDALQLAAAAAAARDAMGAPLPPADQARLDAALAPARDALGPAAAEIWAAGAAMSLDAALDVVRLKIGE